LKTGRMREIRLSLSSFLAVVSVIVLAFPRGIAAARVNKVLFE